MTQREEIYDEKAVAIANEIFSDTMEVAFKAREKAKAQADEDYERIRVVANDAWNKALVAAKLDED